jgi:hypothetical protein
MMANLKNQDAMSKSGRVSIWLGNGIVNECEMDKYLSLDRRFDADFGFVVDGPAGPEYSRLAWSGEAKPAPVEELLKEFSFSESWLAAAVELARTAGWREARAAVVFYAFEYDRSLIRNREAPLSFIGTVEFGEEPA